MWDWIVNILFELLKLIQTFAVDWGLSIIILVVIIRPVSYTHLRAHET